MCSLHLSGSGSRAARHKRIKLQNYKNTFTKVRFCGKTPRQLHQNRLQQSPLGLPWMLHRGTAAGWCCILMRLLWKTLLQERVLYEKDCFGRMSGILWKNPIAVACCGKTVVLWILKKQEIGQGREDAWCLLPPWKDGVQGKVSGVCLSETAPGFVCVFHVRSLPVLLWKTVQRTAQAVRRASLAWFCQSIGPSAMGWRRVRPGKIEARRMFSCDMVADFARTSHMRSFGPQAKEVVYVCT